MKDNNSSDAIFSKVLTIGPSRFGQGGIASVLKIYNQSIPGFKQLPTNSSRGIIPGMLAAVASFLRMPIERLRGRSILHIHAASYKSFVRKRLFVYWGKTLGFKIVYHCHGKMSREYFFALGIDKVKNYLDKCDVIIALSDWWKNYFDSTFHHRKVVAVYNPQIPVEKIAHPKAKHPLKLLFLGLIRDDKGVFDMIEVMARNRDRWNGRVKLTIGGWGESKRLNNEIKRNNLEPIVDYLGWVDDASKEELFATHDVVILPTYFEGLPMSIIEALGHGMPTISTPVGGIPEMIIPGENGILFTPGDKQAMSAAIDCYLMNPELIDRHGKAALSIVPKFYPEKIKADLKKIYLDLVEK